MYIENISKEMRIFLIRHAQSEANIGKFSRNNFDIHLTEKGKLDAYNAALNLELHPQAILTSPYSRALETAQCIYRCFPEAKFEIHHKLHEMQYAIARDKSEWISKTKAFLASNSFTWKDTSSTESVSDLFSRANSMLTTVYEMTERTILIVTHELFIQAVLTITDCETDDVEEMAAHFFSRLRHDRIVNLGIVEITS